MSDKTIQVAHSILEYDIYRAYFGTMTGAELNDAYHEFIRTRDWDKPVIKSKVHVGYIDGQMICRVLWNEMTYNPVRFGNISPFLHNGYESIYHFCNANLPREMSSYNTLIKVQEKLKNFLTYNCLPNKAWYDIVNPSNGEIIVRFIESRSDDNYKKLSALREAVRAVISQNLQDLNRKKYRTEMLKVIDNRHPNGVRSKKNFIAARTVSAVPMPLSEEELIQDRMDRAIENAQITTDNRRYVSAEQYEQACEDLEIFRKKQSNQNQK